MWGLVNLHGSPKLASSSSIEITATILHHRAPKRGGLNEQTWERITQETIDTEIALPKPGRYRLKAILFDKIESTPVEIQVTEPQTLDDREVWNFISNQPEYALFRQSGPAIYFCQRLAQENGRLRLSMGLKVLLITTQQVPTVRTSEQRSHNIEHSLKAFARQDGSIIRNWR